MGTRRLPAAMAGCSALIAISAVSTVQATNHYFRDLSARSPSGRFHAAASSPDNQRGPRVPFARDFTFTLEDTQSNKLIWARAQAKDEGAPVNLIVDDRGLVGIQTCPDEVIVIDPGGGSEVARLDVRKEFTEEDRKHVHYTSAGPEWASCSLWYFLRERGQPYFVVRTWWDRRVILDIQENRVLRDPGDAILLAARREEEDFVRRTLEGAHDRLKDVWTKGSDEFRDEFRSEKLAALIAIESAVHLAPRLGVRETVPHLQELLCWDRWLSTGGFSRLEKACRLGEIDPFSCWNLGLRREAQNALRRLGAAPREVPCTSFHYRGEDYHRGSEVELDPLPAPRAERVHLLREGMKPLEVLQAIGAPDYVDETSWNYEVDAGEPYTLMVHFRCGEVVGRLERSFPPLWMRNDARYDPDWNG